MDRVTIYIVGGESRSRAEQARIAFALGHHAEVYSDIDELLERPPHDGILLAAAEGHPGAAAELITQLGANGLWLPVVMTSPDPALDEVVAAIKGGALDFLRLPFEIGSFARQLTSIVAEAGRHSSRRRRQVEAHRVVSLLSRREREVLELLSSGCSNKEIAQNLAISPRTVEIHRGKMMFKLRATHAADAVRTWIEARQIDTAGDYFALVDDPRRHFVGRSGTPSQAEEGGNRKPTTSASPIRTANGAAASVHRRHV